MSSPLGKYAALVASISAIGIIAAWIIAEFLLALGISTTSPAGLKEVALIAVGAVFGSAVAVNGWKGPVDVAHSRIDVLENTLQIPTHPNPIENPTFEEG